MKNNKKGFTLIELLAVIVILAIIALIAVPTIMGIINKANKSAFKDTAYGIIDAAELYFAEQQLELNGLEYSKTFDLATDVNVEGGLHLKGEVPKNGKVKINEEGRVSLALDNGRYCITKGYFHQDITITEDYETCDLVATTLSDLTTTDDACLTSAEEGACVGKLFTIQVNSNETKDFYVYSDDGKTVKLIMDRNLGENVEWISAEDYINTYGNVESTCNSDSGICNDLGPITALTYLNAQTSTWKNIEPIESLTQNNNKNGTVGSGYQKLVIENGTGKLISENGAITTTLKGVMRARLINVPELSKLANNGVLPDYVYANTSGQDYFAHWSIHAYPQQAEFVFCVKVENGTGTYVGLRLVPYVAGVRPVIQLSK